MKKRLLSFVLVICVMILGVMGLTACGDEETPSPPQKLQAPVVTLTGNVANWAADSSADRFEISVDGNLSYVENTVTSKALTDGQTLKVRAVGNGITYSTSDWSNSVTYTEGGGSSSQPTKLAAPTVTISATGLASWSTANANSYVYKIDGGAETPTMETSVQLSDGQSIVVKAVGDGTNYTDSDYSASKTYSEGAPSTTGAPTYLGIIASNEEPTENKVPSGLARSFDSAERNSFEQALKNYFSNSDNLLGETIPSPSNYVIFSSAERTVYIQIWLDNSEQNTILSLKLNGTKYQSGGALQSFFVKNGDTYLNCVYVALTIPTGAYDEISYEVTEIEYVEGTNVNQDGKAVLIDEDNDTVKIGLTYESYPTASCGEVEFGCHSANVVITVEDESDLIATKGYWMRAVVLDENGVVCQDKLVGNTQNNVSFEGLTEEKEYIFAVFYLGDKQNGEGVTYNIVHTQSFTTNAVVTVEEFLLGGELAAEKGRNGAKITVCANIAYDANAYFDRLEIYDGQTLVLTDDEFEGFADYSDLNSKTEYTVKMYYSSDEHGYTERVKEISITTPAYELPDIDAYDSDKNVVVGKHAIFGFSIERFVDLKYYDVIVRGYMQNDAYFAPFIVEMLDNPDLLVTLEQQANDHYARPGGYVWEAQYYMGIYLEYFYAWEHKERVGYADDEWREIASSTKQYVYELNVANDGLFVANDGDFVYNYYAVLRDYFAYEDLRFEIYLNVDLGDGKGEREINMYHANPYFREVGDDNYGYSIEEDEEVKNGYVLTETDMDYKTLYVYKLALYKDNEFVCYVPFTSTDTTSIDMDAWLDEWIEKLKCEIPGADEQEMIAQVGAQIVREIFDELLFKEDMGNDIVVDGNGVVGGVSGNKLGNQTERDLLTALSTAYSDTLLRLFQTQTQDNKSLQAFIRESENSTIICVLNDFRDQIEITNQNAYAIYSAIVSVYNNVYDQLKTGYENYWREKYANKEIVDRIEAIEKTSFKFVVGTDVAPAGEYELRVLCRSILKNYEGDEADEPSYQYIRIKRDLQAPTNVKFSEDYRYLTWDVVDGADGYDIYINGEKRFDSWDNSYEHRGEIKNGDIIQVVATGNDAYDSELSAKLTYVQPKLSKPNVTTNGGRVTWERVENATKYVYTINGREYETTETTIYVNTNGAVVSVRAVDENGIYLDSESATVTVTVGGSDKEK